MAGPGDHRGVFASRYAGAMLLHAFASQADAGEVLSAAAGAGEADGGNGRRFADVALLSATSICFALGAATIEQFKHLTAACAGPLAGLAVLPDLRTLRPRLAALADGGDPAGLQATFAAAMLAAEPCAQASTTSTITSCLIRGEAGRQRLEQQARPRGEGPRRHPRHRP